VRYVEIDYKYEVQRVIFDTWLKQLKHILNYNLFIYRNCLISVIPIYILKLQIQNN